MDDERSTRREASVMRYKEKRLTRLFSKKIRYQVRKLNADKRPRLKVYTYDLWKIPLTFNNYSKSS